jgi:hypothetical protein
MARSRNIKPAFFSNDVLAELDFSDRLAFIGLWTLADYKGCMEFRPKRIKAALFPYDNVDIEKIAINLEQNGFIRIYSVQGQQYLKIINFEKHQNPHKNEREAGSDIPDYTEDAAQDADCLEHSIKTDLIGTNTENIGIDRADSLLLIPDSLLPKKEPAYAFAGHTIKVTELDYKKLTKQYPNLDLQRELSQLDLELVGEKKWWQVMNAKLNYRNKNTTTPNQPKRKHQDLTGFGQ